MISNFRNPNTNPKKMSEGRKLMEWNDQGKVITDWNGQGRRITDWSGYKNHLWPRTVSYTHLTLPTILLV